MVTNDSRTASLSRWPLSTSQNHWLAIAAAALIAFIIYLSTVQVIPNGSPHAYTTDVGEIQNALPRWGTLHFPGYPLYSLLGSIFTTALRLVGVEPAAGTSIFSAVWGAISVALLTKLSLDLDVRPLAALATSLLFGLATSVWMDSSLAEVHTMSVALLLASVIAALHFGRTGKRSDLLWLAFLSTQAVLHQRALLFALPGLALLALPKWRTIRHEILPAIGVALAGSLIYLYLPLRDWMGADWTFNAPGTWQGFWSLLLDTKADRIIDSPETVAEISTRLEGLRQLLAHDWPLALLVLGLFGLLGAGFWRGWREPGALLLIALVFPLLTLVIWIGRIGDAALAVNLPTYAMAAVGLGLISTLLFRRTAALAWASLFVWILAGVYLFGSHRSEVLDITRDRSAVELIEQVKGFQTRAGDSNPTLMALWGRDYWALAYAKEFQDILEGVDLVDHNANLEAVLNEQGQLYTLSRTFYLRPLEWWQDTYGPVFLSMTSPGIVRIETNPGTYPETPFGAMDFDLGNGVSVLAADLNWNSSEELVLTLFWQKKVDDIDDYRVAVHLVSVDPPVAPEDILSQADQLNPVDGWYPLSQWTMGEVVQDVYVLQLPEDSDPEAVQLSMYQIDANGRFDNTAWLTLNVPGRPSTS